MGRLVLVAYRPKPGKTADLHAVVREHVPILRGLGLATDRPAVAMSAADGTVVEVFEWVSEEAVKKAHSDPAVLAMWERFGACCDIVPYSSLAEAKEMFPHFNPIDL